MKYCVWRWSDGFTEAIANYNPDSKWARLAVRSPHKIAYESFIQAESGAAAIEQFNKVYGFGLLPIQQIVCPSCHSRQDVRPEDTGLFLAYIHDCTNCGYTIMESEWELAA